MSVTAILDYSDKILRKIILKREQIGTDFSSNIFGNFLGSIFALALNNYFFDEKLTLHIALPIFGLVWIYGISPNLKLAAWSTFGGMIIGLIITYYFLSQPQYKWH